MASASSRAPKGFFDRFWPNIRLPNDERRSSQEVVHTDSLVHFVMPRFTFVQDFGYISQTNHIPIGINNFSVLLYETTILHKVLNLHFHQYLFFQF